MGSLAVAEVPGDGERLTTALDALIENAVRHTDVDGHIELGSRREGESVILSVTDSGSGIAAAEVERIFSRFSRIDAGRNRTAGGFGLGLAIVKAIAEAHNGSVHVRSTVGQGSAFELHLPASVDRVSSRQLQPPPPSRSQSAGAWRVRPPAGAGRAGTASVRRSGDARAQ
jgi:signal transduction histidine kinase